MNSGKVPYSNQYPERLWTICCGGKPVRIFYINNMFWLALTDVCSLIDIGNASSVAARLDDNEKMTLILSNSHSGRRGGAQKLLLINEPGLYDLLSTSEKPEAKSFRHWIMFDVLPSIRRNGGYIMGQDTMDADELTSAALQVTQNILAERDWQIQDLRLENEAKTALLREWQPKVSFCDAVLQSPDALPITVIAKDYGLLRTVFEPVFVRQRCAVSVWRDLGAVSALCRQGLCAAGDNFVWQRPLQAAPPLDAEGPRLPL